MLYDLIEKSPLIHDLAPGTRGDGRSKPFSKYINVHQSLGNRNLCVE